MNLTPSDTMLSPPAYGPASTKELLTQALSQAEDSLPAAAMRLLTANVTSVDTCLSIDAFARLCGTSERTLRRQYQKAQLATPHICQAFAKAAYFAAAAWLGASSKQITRDLRLSPRRLYGIRKQFALPVRSDLLLLTTTQLHQLILSRIPFRGPHLETRVWPIPAEDCPE